MPQDSFELECDRLSHVVDSTLFEHLRWSRTEGPMLARLVELAQSALEERSEFELIEEGATSEIKRFILKVHSNRVMAITFGLAEGRAYVSAEAIDRSKYALEPGNAILADFEAVDEQWMTDALQELFGRIRS